MPSNVDIAGSRLALVLGDITRQDTEAIVNAANSTLLGGGGVDGAIHRAGGPAILEACRKIAARIGRCPTGEAVITTGGALAATWVIHTVGPVWHGGSSDEPELLASAYRNSLKLAASKNIRTLSFPSISTGAYRFPVERAAGVAVTTVAGVLERASFEEVRFVLFSERDLGVYTRALSRLS
ncbi:MAG: O-acetyl-ADP-ribose deacetylase [Candidatus Krumholzibacteriia bacterium]